MESRKVVLHETAIIAIGVAVCTALMLGVYALLGRFDRTVLVGALLGALLAVANFFFMALSASNALDKAAAQDVKTGKNQVRVSYGTRMLVIFAVLFAFAKSGLSNPLASVLPLAFVRPVITVAEFFRRK